MTDKPLVMVVDDEPLLRDLCSRTCSTLLHADVEAFADSESAFFRLNDSPRFDLLLIDYMMPGQDGLSFCLEARKHVNAKHVPIVVLTAAGADAFGAFAAAGANAVLDKPFTPRRLADALREFLPKAKPEGVAPTTRDIVAAYTQGLPTLAGTLQALFAANDPKAAQQWLHKLKGTSGTFGLAEIADAATQIEQALKHGAELQAQAASILALCALLRAGGAQLE